MNLINWSAPNIHVWVFIAQLVEHCSANAEAIYSNPVKALKMFYQAKICNYLNCKYNCDDHISISCELFSDVNTSFCSSKFAWLIDAGHMSEKLMLYTRLIVCTDC